MMFYLYSSFINNLLDYYIRVVLQYVHIRILRDWPRHLGKSEYRYKL